MLKLLTIYLSSDNPWGIILHAIVFLACVFQSVFSQSFNFTLTSTSKCEKGLLHNEDDILVRGIINMDGQGSPNTLYELIVDLTHDNRTFVQICNFLFGPSDCKSSNVYGCYCSQACFHGQELSVAIRLRANENTSSAHFRLHFTWDDQKYGKFWYLPVPHIYGEVFSVLKMKNSVIHLDTRKLCSLSSADLSESAEVVFCAYNLNSPVLTLACDTEGLHTYANQVCGTCVLKRNLSLYTFSYSDSCKRSHTFRCALLTASEAMDIAQLTGQGSHAFSIILGTVLGLVFIFNLLYFMFKGFFRGTEAEDPSEKNHATPILTKATDMKAAEIKEAVVAKEAHGSGQFE